MSRPGIEPGSQELASCAAITARPPQHDSTGPHHRAFYVFQDSCYTGVNPDIEKREAASREIRRQEQKSHLTAHAWYPCVSKESSKRHRGTAPSDSAQQPELHFTTLPVLPAALEFRLETQLCHSEFCSFFGMLLVRTIIIGSAEALPILCVSDFCER